MGSIIPSAPANKGSVSTVNTIINKVLTNFNPQTTSNLNYSNYLLVSDNSTAIGNTQYIEAVNDIQNIVTASQTSNISTNLNNDITQEINRESVALVSDLGSLFANKNIDLATSVKNNVENLHLTNIIPMCVANQDLANIMLVEHGSVAIDNKQTIKSDFIQKCISNFNGTSNTTSDITNAIRQKATVVEKNPLDFLGDIFGNIGLIFSIFFILVIVVGMVIVYKKFMGNKSDNPSESKIPTSKAQLVKSFL